MNWQSLTWEPLDGRLLSAAQGVAEFGDLLRGAIEESASALAQAPIAMAEPQVVRLEAWEDAGGDFAPVATFELMAAARRQLAVGLDPDAGTSLAGAGVVPEILARAIAEGLDAALTDILGEGVNLGPADAAQIPDKAPVLVIRIPLRGPDGTGVDLLAAVEEGVPAELGAHLLALRAMSGVDAPSGDRPIPFRAPGGPLEEPEAPDAWAGLGLAIPSDPASDAPAVPAGTPPTAGPVAAAGTTAIRAATFDELHQRPQERPTTSLDMLLGVSLQVTVEIGRTRLAIRDILGLAPGSIVELDKLAGEPVDVLVNGRQIATGEVVVVDENFGVRITEIVSRQRRIAAGTAA